MSVMGKEGIRKVADLCLQKSHYMYGELIKTGRFKPKFSAPFFKEFALKYTGGDLKETLDVMLRAGFMPGIDLSPIPRLDDCVLIAVTEKRTKAEIDAYAGYVKQSAGELIPGKLLRKNAAELPEVSEADAMRHFVGLSNKNHGVMSGFYPLGSYDEI